MKSKPKTLLVSACAGIFLFMNAASNAQELIASWTFEDLTEADEVTAQTYGPLSPEIGMGSASGFHSEASTDWSNPEGDGSDESFSSNDWSIGDYYEFEVSTLGLSGVEVSWGMYRSGTGPADWEFQYSSDGESFVSGSTFVLENSWSEHTEDLTSLVDLDNQESVAFRLVATSAPSSSAGTARVDNFTVTAIPEPSTYAAAFGAAALAWAVVCRRRIVRR